MVRRDRLQLRPGKRLQPPIPRTDVLADVAAKNPISHAAAEISRDSVAELNGEIRDTTPGLELIGGRERVRRARVQTDTALPAISRASLVRLQRCCGDNGADEQVGAQGTGEQV